MRTRLRTALITALCAAIVFAACSPRPNGAADLSAPLGGLQVDPAVLDSVARAALIEQRAPGLAIAVMVGDSVVLARGYGVAEIESGRPPTPRTPFRIGSITKQFTAAAIMRLIEEGRVSLDDEIARFLPAYPTQGHRVTVRHLLNHTSGIRSYTSLPNWLARVAEPLSPNEILAFFRDEPFDFAPGERVSYNNSGYYLLGLIIETVTGRSYAEYLASEFFEPLGLHDTFYCPDEPADTHAHGYRLGEAGPLPSIPISMNHPFAAGALCSTAMDLVRWTRHLVDGRVVSEVSYRSMTAPAILNDGTETQFGYGLMLGPPEGVRTVFHGGGIFGFSSALVFYPDADVTVAVLANGETTNTGLIEEALARMVLGIPAPEVRGVTEEPPHQHAP